MISFLSSWVKNLCLELIVVSILEMILPNNKTKKFPGWEGGDFVASYKFRKWQMANSTIFL